ncbi:hypothetical protein PL11201_60030 [Planktothrix sp. PCC 11201]|nr:hypothetical protein PL11201_60030 [Planktothrix sp. PCC 11201]
MILFYRNPDETDAKMETMKFQFETVEGTTKTRRQEEYDRIKSNNILV